eukprot:gene11347-13230_t
MCKNCLTVGKDKLRKFAEIDTFDNVYQLDAGKTLKGKWAAEHFKNDHPLVLELACGKGEYSVGLARMFPEKNFIGIDLKGNRIWRGARTGVDEGIKNLAFLRIQIEDIMEFFAENEVDEIWITFPDPQPQESREKKRLTFPGFLSKYKAFLKVGGKINLKTDNDVFLKLMDQNFYEQVFELVRLIPKGRVTSYGAIAKSLGAGRASRMVGYAMRNAALAHPPIPAHRVVNSSGLLTGKFHFNPPELMVELLEAEGIVVKEDKVQQFKKVFWDPLIEL